MITLSEDIKIDPHPAPLLRTFQGRAVKGNRYQRICIWRRWEVEEFEQGKNSNNPYLPDCNCHEHVSESRVLTEILLAPLYKKSIGKGREKIHFEAQWLVADRPSSELLKSPFSKVRLAAEEVRAMFGDQCSVLVMNEVMEMVIRKSVGFDVHQLARY